MHCERGKMNAAAELRLLACLILLVGLTLGFGSNQEMEFTFLLPAGSTECFYQTTTRNDSMEVEYQVNIISPPFFPHVCRGLSGTVTL